MATLRATGTCSSAAAKQASFEVAAPFTLSITRAPPASDFGITRLVRGGPGFGHLPVHRRLRGVRDRLAGQRLDLVLQRAGDHVVVALHEGFEALPRHL